MDLPEEGSFPPQEKYHKNDYVDGKSAVD